MDKEIASFLVQKFYEKDFKKYEKDLAKTVKLLCNFRRKNLSTSKLAALPITSKPSPLTSPALETEWPL
jgi:hypothetical protein